MRSLMCAVLLLCAAPSAWAEDLTFDLGFAHPGMAQAQFRAGPWSEGTVICSNDADRPAGVDFTLPKNMLRAKAEQCGLYGQDVDGHWHPQAVPMAGWPGELRATFLPDPSGTLRLLQLKLKLPEAAFDDVAQAWDKLFGLPTFRRDRVVHWSNAAGDAAVIGDGHTPVTAYVLDNQMHSGLNRRLGHMPAQH